MDDPFKRSFIIDDADSPVNMNMSEISDVNHDISVNYRTADSITDISDQDISINYQTIDGDNSKYFSAAENDSTLEGICDGDLSLQNMSEHDTLTESRHEDAIDTSVKVDLDICNAATDKFDIDEQNDNMISGGIDIFDDESSVDGHELVIDDDPQPSEKSDECPESGTETSTDMPYKSEVKPKVEIDEKKPSPFNLMKVESEASENINNTLEINEESDNSQLDPFKDFPEDSEEIELKTDNYNFPEGSHRVSLLIDGMNVEAINIGQDIYIYTNSNGELTAFQVIKEDGNLSVKYLQVGKNEDGNIEVYEEQVSQISDSSETADSSKEKEIKTEKADEDLEKNSQNLIKAVLDQEKKMRDQQDSTAVDDEDVSSDALNIDLEKSKEDESTVDLKKDVFCENSTLEKIDEKPPKEILSDEKPCEEPDLKIDASNDKEIPLQSDDSIKNNNNIMDSDIDVKSMVKQEDEENVVDSKPTIEAEDIPEPAKLEIQEVPEVDVKPVEEEMETEVKNPVEPALDSNIAEDVAQLPDVPAEEVSTDKVSEDDVKNGCEDLDSKISDPVEIDMKDDVDAADDDKLVINLDEDNSSNDVELVIEPVEPEPLCNDADEAMEVTPKLESNNISENSNVSLDSDEGDDVIEGEPVTGDCGSNWFVEKPSEFTEKLDVPIIQGDLIEDKVEIVENLDKIEESIVVESDTESKDQIEQIEINNCPEVIEVNNDVAVDVSENIVSKVEDTVEIKEDVVNNDVVIAENDTAVDKDDVKTIKMDIENDNTQEVNHKVNGIKESTHEVKTDKCESLDAPSDECVVNNSELEPINYENHISDFSDMKVNLNSNIKSYVAKKCKTVYLPMKSYKLNCEKPEPKSNMDIARENQDFKKKYFESIDLSCESQPIKKRSIDNIDLKNKLNKDDTTILVNIARPEMKIISPPKIDGPVASDLLFEVYRAESETSLKKSEQTRKETVEVDDIAKNKDVFMIEESPKCKFRTPRKQVFTPVQNTDIEMIFSDIENIDKISSTPKVLKNYGRPKLKSPNSNKSPLNLSSKLTKNSDNADAVEVTSESVEKLDESLGEPDSQETNHSVISDESLNTTGVSESSVKRKRGRPKKLPVTEPPDEEDKSSDVVSEANNSQADESLSENICPICSKNFRSKNVLLKHAKHCNGVAIEAVKTPKLKKKVKFESKRRKTDESVKSTEDSEDDRPLKQSDDSKTIVIDDSICETPKNDSCERIPLDIDADKSHDENVQPISKDEQPKAPEKVSKVPVKIPKKREFKKTVVASPMSRLSKILSVKPPVNQVIKCEVCGKSFRQYAHMVYHRKIHDTPAVEPVIPPAPVKVETKPEEPILTDTNAILKCEICKKGFRKLHHLVEHREMHIHAEVKTRRASVVSVKSEPEGGFRCDTCDKSFRKLHHLVEHRELHAAEIIENTVKETVEEKPAPVDDATCNGCGKTFRKRHHMVEHRDIHCSPNKIKNTGDSSLRLSITSTTSEDSNNCDICGKSYRKLHHMVEHRGSHGEAAKQAEDARIPSPDVLITTDLIHECSKCYMVFPNMNSLNKHLYSCLNKKVSRKSTSASDSTEQANPERKSIRISTENKNKTVGRELRKSLDASKAKKDDDDKPLNTLKTIGKVKAVPKPKAEATVSKLRQALKSESQIKYKINKNFKADLKPAQSGKNSPKPAVSKLRKSDAATTQAKRRNSKVMETITEEDSFRYSFPKSPKPDKVKTARKSVIPNTSKRKSTGEEPKVIAKRRSIGSRKSLDGKSLPKTPKKLELRCCNRVFNTQSALAIHRKTHKESKKVHRCDCGKQFDNDILLRRHIESEHTPPKSFKCQICSLSVRTLVQLVKHKKTHEPTAQSSTRKPAKTADKNSNEIRKTPGKTVTPTPTQRKRRSAHAGVPLPEKLRKAFANANQ